MQAAYEYKGIKNGVDSFAAAHAATHMGQCVRTNSIAAPHHQEMFKGGHKRKKYLLCQIYTELPTQTRN
jgi:hypothetical protein